MTGPSLEDEGFRSENLVAVHLLKAVQLWTDLGFGEFSLHYLRDKPGREVDFLVARGKKPAIVPGLTLLSQLP